MSGRKQHFIPRHFLKEFANERDKHWLYRRGLSEPKEVSRKDVAAQKDFYSGPKTMTGVPTLDDLITEYENKLQSYINKVRAVEVGKSLPANLMSEIVVHLTIRSAYFREYIDAGIDTFFCYLIDFFGNTNFPGHYVPSQLDTIIIKEIEDHIPYLPENLRLKTITRLFYQIMRENYDDSQEKTSNSLKIIKENFKKINIHIQNQYLEKDMAPVSHKTMLKKLQWKVIDFPFGNAVLSDCISIAEDVNGWKAYRICDVKKISRVVIPLTSSKLAVGHIANDWKDVRTIYNNIARKNSFTFYLTNQKEKISENHIVNIGNRERKKIKDDILSKVHGVGEKFISCDSSVRDKKIDTISWNDLSTNKNLSYSILFGNCKDNDFKTKATNIFSNLIEDSQKYFFLHHFDGITFVTDVKIALQEIEEELNPFRYTYFNDIAMPYIMRYPNGLKTHLFIKKSLVKQWISDNKMLYGRDVIYKCLAITSFNTIFEKKFPDKFFTPFEDPYENYLYEYNNTILSLYFYNRFLTFNEGVLQLHSEHVNFQFEQMLSATKDANMLLQKNDDHEKFLALCIAHVSNFMTGMATFLSIRATLGDQQQNLLLDKTLKKCGLSNWAKCFSKDLDTFYCGLQNWINIDEMLFINRHFERLLSEVGIMSGQIINDIFHFHTFNESRLYSLITSDLSNNPSKNKQDV